MAKITFYSTSGHQVDPKATNPADPPSPIGGLIDHEIEFYIDYDRLIVVSFIWAESSAAGNRKVDSFYAVYQGDSRRNLLENFIFTLDKIESGDISTDHTWEFPHDNDDRYELPWFAQSQLDSDLTDMGLTYAEQLATQELIEAGESMDVGVIDWKVAAVPAVFIATKTDGRCELAISRNGRQSVLSDVAVVIQPGKNANFRPLTDSTASKFQHKKENLKETIKEQCQVIFNTRLEDLNEKPIEQREHDLLRVRDFLQGTEEPNFRTEVGADIVDHIMKVTDGGIVADKYDTNSLNHDESQVLVDSFENTIQTEIDELRGGEIRTEYQTRLKELIDQSTLEPLENRHNIISKIISVFDGEKIGSNNQILQDVENVYNEMLGSNLLASAQQTEIENHVNTYAKEIKSNIERIRREDIEKQLENARSTIKQKSLERQKRVVESIEDELSPVGTRQSTVEQLPAQYRKVINQLNDGPILETDIKTNIRNKELAEIRELEDHIEDNLYEQTYEDIKNKIEQKQRVSHTIQEEIHLLQGVQELLKTPTKEFSLPDDVQMATKQRLSGIDEAIRTAGNKDVLAEVFQTICNDLRDYCRDEIKELRETKLEEIQREIVQETKRIVDGLPPEKKLTKISQRRSNLRQIKSTRLTGTNIKPIEKALANMGSPYHHKETFDSSDISDLIEHTIDELDELEEEYQEEYRNTLQRDFNQNLASIVDTDELLDKVKLNILRNSRKKLKGNDKKAIRKSKYANNMGELDSKMDLDGVKNGVNAVNPNSDSKISETYQRDLRENFLEDIEKHIDEITSDNKDMLVKNIEREIQKDILPKKPYNNRSYDTLESAHKELGNLKEIGGSQRISYPFLNNREWFDLLPDRKKQQVHTELISAINEWQKELKDAIDDISKTVYQAKFQKIKQSQNILDKIVALKQFQNVLDGTRSDWPELVTHEESISPSDIEFGTQGNELKPKVNQELSRQVADFEKIETNKLDETLSESYDSDKPAYHHMLGEIKKKIESPSYSVEDDSIPYIDRIEKIHSKLGRLGDNDEIYVRIRRKLNSIATKYEEKWETQESTADSGIIATIHSTVSDTIDSSVLKIRSYKPKFVHLAIILLLIAPLVAFGMTEIPSGILGRLSIGSLSVILLLTVPLVTVGMIVILGELLGGSSDSTVVSNGTEMEFTSMSFVGTPSGNNTLNYTLDYSVDNIDLIDRIHQVEVTNVQTTSKVTVSATDAEGTPIKTENVRYERDSTSSQGPPREYIEFELIPNETTTLSNVQVSLEGEIETSGISDSGERNVTVNIYGEDGIQINRSASLRIIDESE